jgi:hypothetical protein
MSGKTNPVSAAVLGLFTGTQPALHSQTWVSLFTTNPTTDGSSTSSYPITGTDYVEWGGGREQVLTGSNPLNNPHWDGPEIDPVNTNRCRIKNSTTFGWQNISGLSASGDTVTGVGVWDSETGGNLLYWDVLDNPRFIQNGDTFQFLAGSLVIRED